MEGGRRRHWSGDAAEGERERERRGGLSFGDHGHLFVFLFHP